MSVPALLLGLSSCQGADDVGAQLPAGPGVVGVTLRDHRFDYPPVVPAGRVVLRFTNAGSVEHHPMLLRAVGDDSGRAGGAGEATGPFAGSVPLGPGQRDSIAVDLVVGRRYRLICFARDPDGSSHALKGMSAELRPVASGPPPTT